MDPNKTAVVLVEFQNDFTSPGGALHEAVRGSMEATGMLANAQAAVAAAREAGATIIHAPDPVRGRLRRDHVDAPTGSSRAWSTPTPS